MSFQVGQTVILRDRGDHEVTITRVGRKYAYIVRYGRELAFNAETGEEKDHAYGTPAYIYTPEMIAEKDRRAAVVKRLGDLGVAWRDYGDGRKYSTEKLEAVADILEAE